MKQTVVRLQKYWPQSGWRKRLLYSLIGSLGGYAYYHFVGCSTGTCPITSNPWVSTLYGAGMGYLLTTGARKNS